jgi:tetratricopeptide (TPR) repeat protein
LLDGDVDDAISKYTQALQSLPDFAPCYAYRALAYIQAKQYTAALQDCSKALALDDKLEPVYFRKG